MREMRWLLLVAIGIGLAVGVVSDVVSHALYEPPAARVLIVDNSLNHPIYVPEREWKPYLRGVPYDVVHIPGGDAIPSVDRYTHMILSGSTASLVDPPAWAVVEARLVSEAADSGLAILGSCFGHQMLVYALSGDPYVRRAAVPEVGWIAVKMTAEDDLFAEAPNPWHAFAWHNDEVVDLPEPWRVLGRSTMCGAHVIRYGDAEIWGLQSHPETRPVTAKLLLFLDWLIFDRGSEEIWAALCQTPREDRILDRVMERFLDREP